MKGFNKTLTVLLFFLAIIIIPVISLIFMPKERNTFSENENRYLAVFPKFNIENILNAGFTRGFEEWANDRIIGRESWVRLKNKTERLLGKTEINGVYIIGGRMMQVWSGYDITAVNRTLEAMNRFSDRHGSIPVYIMLAPTSQEIYASLLPRSAPAASQNEFITYCYEYLTNITPIDVLTPLANQASQYIYYRTDHHWTTLGAYFAYAAAAPVLGFEPFGPEDFNIGEVSRSFMGSLYSKTLIEDVTPDIISVYTLINGEPESVVLTNANSPEPVNESLYFAEYLEKKDKYPYFLGENKPIVNVYTHLADENANKKLLIFKDSYANSLIPFFAKHYSEITAVDMRLLNSSYGGQVKVEDYDAVLFMYNVVTFSEDDRIVRLNLG